MAWNTVKKYLYKNRTTLTVYLLLRGLVILSMIRAFFRADYHSVLLCILSLALLILPSILAHRLEIRLPGTLEITILLFVFAAEILGEINNFYVRVPHWDTMLHTINGFLCAAIGFALLDLLNRSERFTFRLSPAYLAIMAFCFSMTVGALWEIFEFAADSLVPVDMQKDTVIQSFNSVYLDPTQTNTAIPVRGVTDVILVYEDGSQQALGLGGYLDVGLRDSMKDLIVNLVGAVIFSIIGYFYVRYEGRGKLAVRFIPEVMDKKTENKDSK